MFVLSDFNRHCLIVGVLDLASFQLSCYEHVDDADDEAGKHPNYDSHCDEVGEYLAGGEVVFEFHAQIALQSPCQT